MWLNVLPQGTRKEIEHLINHVSGKDLPSDASTRGKPIHIPVEIVHFNSCIGVCFFLPCKPVDAPNLTDELSEPCEPSTDSVVNQTNLRGRSAFQQLIRLGPHINDDTVETW